MKEKSVFRQLLRLLRIIHIRPLYFTVPVVLALGAAAFEGLGLSLLIPILNGFLTKDYSFVKDTPVIGSLISALPIDFELRDRNLFLFVIGLFVCVILFKNVFRYGASVSMAFLSTRALHHLRKHIFDQYLTFGKKYFDRTTVGYHSTLISQFTTNALIPLAIIDKFIAAIFSVMAYLCVMMFISWKLTLYTMPFFFVLHFVVRRFITSIQRMSKMSAANAGELGKKVVEILTVIPLVKVSNARDREFAHYTQVSDEAASLEYRKTVIAKLITPMQELITLFSVLALFGVMLFLLIESKTTEATSFLVYFYVILNAANKFSALSSFHGDFVANAGALEEVLNVFDPADKEVIPEGKDKFAGFSRSIDFKDVRFSYKDDVQVLNGLSLRIEHGKMTAIVGPTGAGKTTVISLLLRQYDCAPGSIFLDDRDIRGFSSESLLSRIALVSQETLLLNDSLLHNISYGKEGASMEEVRDVVRRARLDELVQRLPDGLDTLIGDRGVMLSGGEKQRVSIARALLRGAEILILDEATSSLDAKTEQMIQEAMDDASKGRTAIVIAHRLSTIKNADRIVVMDNGRCVEQGSLDELLSRKGLFHEYWQKQTFA